MKPISQMTADEYKQWLLNNPDEAKKLDESGATPIVAPSGFWRNGSWIKLENQNTQTAVGPTRAAYGQPLFGSEKR